MKNSLLLLFFILISVKGFTKEILTNGFYLTKENDTVACTFVLKGGVFSDGPDTLSLYEEVYILDSLNNKVRFTASNINGFLIVYNGYAHYYRSFKNSNYLHGQMKGAIPNIFLREIITGHLNLYYYQCQYRTQYGIYVNTDGVLIKPDKQQLVINFYGLIQSKSYKELSRYLSDYPDLSEKIADKTYKLDDIILIVKKYNQWKDAGGIVIQDTTVYTIVDEIPLFENNTTVKIEKFFYSKLPSSTRLKTRIYFQAIVEKDGKLTDIQLLKGADDNPELNAKLLEIANTLPNWKPGKNNSKIVRALTTFYVNPN